MVKVTTKTSFLIAVIIASLLIGGLIGFYFYTKTKVVPAIFLGRESGHVNFGNINPDKKTSDSDLFIKDPKEVEEVIPKLRKISDVPVAGADFIQVAVVATSSSNKNIEPPDGVQVKVKTKTTTKEAIRFIERGTGHIFDTATSTLKNSRVSNTTLPKIYEALFTNKGDNLILRDLIGNTDIIRSRYGKIDFATTTDEEKSLTTTDLPINITAVAISPSKTKIFSILKNGITGILSQVDGGSKIGLLDIPFKEWLVNWPVEDSIILTTKASAYSPGFAYSLNTKNKSFTRIFGGYYGFTTLPSNDASRFLFSQSNRGQFKLSLFTKKDNSVRNLTVTTLPEKCVWAKTDKSVIYCAVPTNLSFNVYPDVWYQGLLVFSDDIWKINVDTGESRQIAVIEKESNGEIIDVINPVINSDDGYLMFTNKIDLSLWGLQLKEYPKKATINPIDIQATSTGSTTKN